jgi:hypothetical protein
LPYLLQATAPFRSHSKKAAAAQQAAATEAHAIEEAHQASQNLKDLALLLQVKEQQLRQLTPSRGDERYTSTGGCQPLEACAAAEPQAVMHSPVAPLNNVSNDVMQHNFTPTTQGSYLNWLDKYSKRRGIATCHKTLL